MKERGVMEERKSVREAMEEDGGDGGERGDGEERGDGGGWG